MTERHDKPNFLVYLAYLGVFAVALNTVYLVLPNDTIRWYLLGFIIIAVLTGYVLDNKYYVSIGLLLDVGAIGLFVYYAYKIFLDRSAFGTHLGEMLSVMLVMRCFRLFRYQDFLLPLIISLTLMIFSAIPSFSSEFVYSLLGFMGFMGMALFLGNIDEFARLPRQTVIYSRLKYTYDFLEEYSPVPVSKQRPKKIARYMKPALAGTIPAVLTAFIISSISYFSFDHTQGAVNQAMVLSAFGASVLDNEFGDDSDLMTGTRRGGTARHYVGFDDEFNIAGGRLMENSTSTDTVMEVSSNLPSFWRGKVFDIYTGKGWLLSENIPTETWRLDPPAAQTTFYHSKVYRAVLSSAGIEPDPSILKDEIHQTYYLFTDLPGIVFTAYQPVELFMPIPSVRIDDTFTIHPPPSADSMVSGQQYKVTSLKTFAVGDYLDDFDYELNDLKEDDPEFYGRYTQLPEYEDSEGTSQVFDFLRVRAKSYEITAGAKTVYQKVKQLENFLKSRFSYSLNPPVVPPEKDAVDYFLFDWEPKRGHCEYFSSSLAVMCRSIGIPARLVTGYATGNYNLLKNRYIVQEKHAHAWVEVFWPDIGWVEFDATPITWFHGIGEKAFGRWVAFNNAVENLYVYDAKSYIKSKILPALGRAWYGARYQVNQRELDFNEFIQPMLPRINRNFYVMWSLVILATVLLVAIERIRKRSDPNFDRLQAVHIGNVSMVAIKKRLVKNGVDQIKLSTEVDCILQSKAVSSEWSKSVSTVVEGYQEARYSGRHLTSADYIKLRKAIREERNLARKTLRSR